MSSPSQHNITAMDRFFTPWLPTPQSSYLFTNANVVDTAEGIIRQNVSILIANGLIISINDIISDAPTDVIEVDLEGKYLCPGLIDAHVHIGATPGEKDLQALHTVPRHTVIYRTTYVFRDILSRGFTTVRDCGGADLSMKEAIQQGVVPGPRLYIAGHALSQTGGHGDMRSSHQHQSTSCGCGNVGGLARICDGVAECLHAARDELRRGVDFIKIMGSGGMISPTDKLESVQFTPEEIRTITSVTAAAGTYATSHAYTPAAIRNSIENGVMGIEHGNLIDEATARLMAEKGVYLTPTLATFATMAEGLFAEHVPLPYRNANKALLAAGQRAIKIAKAAGVTMCFGSDLLGPLSTFQSREFSLRATTVLTPIEILQSATVNPAKMMGLPQAGQVKEGFWADLIVLKSNPLEDITVLDRTKTELLAVFKDGRPYYSKLAKITGSLNVPT